LGDKDEIMAKTRTSTGKRRKERRRLRKEKARLERKEYFRKLREKNK
jgi:hypothetical protein